VEAQVAQQRTRDAQKSITDIFEAARKVRACEWAVIQGASDSERQALRLQAEEFFGAMKKGPTGTHQAIKEALAKSDTVTGVDLEARERALRILCIRCEILSDKPTPVEDENLRREFQVQRLMQGLGQGALSNDWNAMLVEWIRINAVAPDLHDSLQSRFMSRWLENAAGAARSAVPPRQQRHESRPRS
jgi:hypothetical protein